MSDSEDLNNSSVDTASGPAEIAVAFTQILRGVGLGVPISCTHTFAEALCATGIAERHATYWAGRATLVMSNSKAS